MEKVNVMDMMLHGEAYRMRGFVEHGKCRFEADDLRHTWVQRNIKLDRHGARYVRYQSRDMYIERA